MGGAHEQVVADKNVSLCSVRRKILARQNVFPRTLRVSIADAGDTSRDEGVEDEWDVPLSRLWETGAAHPDHSSCVIRMSKSSEMTTMTAGVSVKEAARVLRKSPMTLRRWIKAGAPCVSLGEVGRGHGAIVDLDAIQRWRAAQVAPGLTDTAQAVQLDQLAESLWRVLRSDEADRKVGISERQAAGLLLLAFERLSKDLTHRAVDLEGLPPRMKQLCAISTG